MNSGNYFSTTLYTVGLLSRTGVENLLKKTNVHIRPTVNFGTSSVAYQQPEQDFYDILGVEKTASAKDIKAAYYQLSKKYHPDVSGGRSADARHFHQITEAYEVLGNDEKRRVYDEQHFKKERIYDAGGPADPDLEMLREFQRKWNMRRHYTHSQAQHRMKSEFEMKHDKEEFEAFYRRYRENVAKAKRWDEAAAEARGREPHREHYSEFQKEMLRRQHARQTEHTSGGHIFVATTLITSFVLYLIGGRY